MTTPGPHVTALWLDRDAGLAAGGTEPTTPQLLLLPLEAEPSFIGGLPEDRITVTAEHEIAATDPDAEAEAEAEWADNWDSADSAAYMDRVEAGLEPEVEP
jgi:hypothetical protein